MKHELGKCPAEGTKCKNCKKPNHLLKVRRKHLNKVNSLQESDRDSNIIQRDDDYLHILTPDSENHVTSIQDIWLTDVTVSNKKLSFRIDTGAK